MGAHAPRYDIHSAIWGFISLRVGFQCRHVTGFRAGLTSVFPGNSTSSAAITKRKCHWLADRPPTRGGVAGLGGARRDRPPSPKGFIIPRG